MGLVDRGRIVRILPSGIQTAGGPERGVVEWGSEIAREQIVQFDADPCANALAPASVARSEKTSAEPPRSRRRRRGFVRDARPESVRRPRDFIGINLRPYRK